MHRLKRYFWSPTSCMAPGPASRPVPGLTCALQSCVSSSVKTVFMDKQIHGNLNTLTDPPILAAPQSGKAPHLSTDNNRDSNESPLIQQCGETGSGVNTVHPHRSPLQIPSRLRVNDFEICQTPHAVSGKSARYLADNSRQTDRLSGNISRLSYSG
jgi:hypothetical protein